MDISARYALPGIRLSRECRMPMARVRLGGVGGGITAFAMLFGRARNESAWRFAEMREKSNTVGSRRTQWATVLQIAELAIVNSSAFANDAVRRCSIRCVPAVVKAAACGRL